MMTEFLLLGACWLLLSLPTSVLVGKCIGVGQAGETARHAADAVLLATTEAPLPAGARVAQAAAGAALPTVPAQRRPTTRTSTRTSVRS